MKTMNTPTLSKKIINIKNRNKNGIKKNRGF